MLVNRDTEATAKVLAHGSAAKVPGIPQRTRTPRLDRWSAPWRSLRYARTRHVRHSHRGTTDSHSPGVGRATYAGLETASRRDPCQRTCPVLRSQPEHHMRRRRASRGRDRARSPQFEPGDQSSPCLPCRPTRPRRWESFPPLCHAGSPAPVHLE